MTKKAFAERNRQQRRNGRERRGKSKDVFIERRKNTCDRRTGNDRRSNPNQ